jgi:hypothetical protein
MMLRRDELPPHATCDGCALGRGVMEDNIHMLIFMCPSHPRRRLFTTACAIRSRTADACRHGVQKYLKARTGLLKMGDKCDVADRVLLGTRVWLLTLQGCDGACSGGG